MKERGCVLHEMDFSLAEKEQTSRMTTFDLFCGYLIASLNYIRVVGFGVEKDHQLSGALVQVGQFITILL